MELLFSSNQIFVTLVIVAFAVIVLCVFCGRKSPYFFDTIEEWQEWINQASYPDLIFQRAELMNSSHKRPSAYMKIIQLIDKQLLSEIKLPLDTDDALVVDNEKDFVEKLQDEQAGDSLAGVCPLPCLRPKPVIVKIPDDALCGKLLGVLVADDLLICPPKIALDYTAVDALHFAKLNQRQLLYETDVARLIKLKPKVAAVFRALKVDFDEKALFWGLANSDDLSLSEKDLLVAYALYSGHDCTNVKLDEKRALICKI